MRKRPLGRSLIFSIGVGFFWAFGFSVGAQASPTSQLFEVLQQVSQNYPGMLAEQERLQAAREETRAASGAFDTRIESESESYGSGFYTGSRFSTLLVQPLAPLGIDLFSGYRLGRGSFPVYEEEFATNNSGEVLGGIRLPLLRGSQIDERRGSLARATVEEGIAERTFGTERVSILKQAAQLYWRWLGKHIEVGIKENLVQVAEARRSQVEIRVSAGELPALELQDGERVVFMRRGDLERARADLAREKRSLEVFLGSTALAQLAPRSAIDLKQLPQLPLAKMVEKALSLRPDIHALKLEIERLEVEKALARNQLLPRLDLEASVHNDFGSGLEERDETETKVGVMFSVPLQNRFARGKEASVEAKLREQKHALELLERQVEAHLLALSTELERTEDSYHLLKKEQQAAEQLEQGELKRFSAGDSSLFLVNIRERDSAEARLRVVESAIIYSLFETELLAALGYGQSTELIEPRDWLKQEFGINN